MCLYVNCWTFQGYKLPVEQRINIRRIRTLPFFLFLVFKRYIYRLGVKFFLFSLSCFQKTYFKQTVSKILPFSFPCPQKTYLQTGSETLPFSFFLVFRRHIYKKEKKKTIPHSNSVFSPCFPNTYLQKKEERKRKTSCTFKFCRYVEAKPIFFFLFSKDIFTKKDKNLLHIQILPPRRGCSERTGWTRGSVEDHL